MSAAPDRAKSVFLAALEVPAGEARQAHLAAACAGDEGLLREVSELLRHHEGAGAFLDVPAPPPGVTTAPSAAAPPTEPGRGEHAGLVLGGRYRLLEPVGEGGMGSVWTAQQTEPVKRLVAVKLIKAGMDSRQVLTRFEAERQALALMDHPNIAKVLDAGTAPDGRPFFVMELVKGVPITKYCDEHRLTPRQRLGLFLPVCQAIQHAHQKGVIHRDIKPSNVLVALCDDRPVPEVIDFGIAKAAGQALTERTLHTGLGAVVGTPEYMSPEQASFNNLDIDTRSDVYALGVLLYELLTGSPPFSKKDLEKAGLLEVLRVVREQEPPRPSTRLSTAEGLPTLAANRGTEPKRLTALVRGELDWIVMRALEKDRARRYETANGFAADVQRYLADEPVQACPPSASYRLRKFLRRNRATLVPVSVVALAVLLTVGTLGWAVRDRAAREEANARELAARQDKLDEEVIRALGEAESFYKRGRLSEALAQLKRAEVLLASAEGRAELQQQVRRWRADLGMVSRLEEIRLQPAAAIKDGHFDTGSSDPAYQQAFREYGLDVEALDPDVAAERIRTSAIRDSLLDAVGDWMFSRDVARGRGNSRVLWEVARRADPDPWRNRLRDAFQARDKKALRELAGDPNVLAQSPSSLCLLGRALDVTREFSLAAAIFRRAQQRHPDDFWINLNLAYYLYRLPSRLTGERIGYYRAALALRPESPGAHHHLGSALLAEKRWPEAELEYREALRLQPGYFQARVALLNTLEQQGKLADLEAESREAIRYAAQAKQRLDEAAARVADEPAAQRIVGGGYCSLALQLKDAKLYSEAMEVFKPGVALLEKLAEKFPANEAYRRALAESYHNWANAVSKAGPPQDAEAAHRRSRDVWEKMVADFPGKPAYRSGLAYSHGNLAIELKKLGRSQDAEQSIRQWVSVVEKLSADFPDAHDYFNQFADALNNLTFDLRESGRPAEARILLESAIARLKSRGNGKIDDPDARRCVRYWYWSLAEALVQLKDYRAAVGAADELARYAYEKDRDPCRAARFLAWCVPMVESDTNLSPSERKELAQSYADRAMGYLHVAVANGFRDANHLKTFEAYAALRSRSDFQRLLAEMEMKKP
jgi:serine/threonine protein kinase